MLARFDRAVRLAAKCADLPESDEVCIVKVKGNHDGRSLYNRQHLAQTPS
jgi:hypothetical protein